MYRVHAETQLTLKGEDQEKFDQSNLSGLGGCMGNQSQQQQQQP